MQPSSLQQSKDVSANVLHVYIYVSDGCEGEESVGGTGFSLVLCLAEQPAVAHFTVSCWLLQPHWPWQPRQKM